MKKIMKAYSKEIAVAVTILALMIVLAFVAPGYFTRENLIDLFLANAPVMIIALGMTLIILLGQIDISVGSVFAICSVVAGISARWGFSGAMSGLIACMAGVACGALNGTLTAYLRVPSIVVTLATMVALRDSLRWKTQGSWIGNLPSHFQWLGLTQSSYTAVVFLIVSLLILLFILGLHYLRIGRAVFATGSHETAARIVGINTERVTFFIFIFSGLLTGLAAMLNSVRFNQIPSNLGLGLEMKVIAAVAVGGTSITGGSGTILGTALGVILLGSIGTALTFLGMSAYWEKAIQGGIILAAVAMNVLGSYRKKDRTHLDALPN